MSNEYIKRVDEGWRAWNRFREENADVKLDLCGANFRTKDLREYDLSNCILRGADFSGADLTCANLSNSDFAGVPFVGANLSGAQVNLAHANQADFSNANLDRARFQNCSAVQINFSGINATDVNLHQTGAMKANLQGANLVRAKLDGSHFNEANFRDTNLQEASLVRVNLAYADFTRANLVGSSLIASLMIGTQFESADLSGARVYGISAWDLNLHNAKQNDLAITPPPLQSITVDNLEVAQFLYLLIHNSKVREVIETITSKVVVILGRFTIERKAVLDAMREELRLRGYLPIVFDFESPKSRDVGETVALLARLAKFVIADLTDPRSLPHELMEFVPHTPSVPVQPIILAGEEQYALFDRLSRYSWVLPVYEYASISDLLSCIASGVINPAEIKVAELRGILGK